MDFVGYTPLQRLWSSMESVTRYGLPLISVESAWRNAGGFLHTSLCRVSGSSKDSQGGFHRACVYIKHVLIFCPYSDVLASGLWLEGGQPCLARGSLEGQTDLGEVPKRKCSIQSHSQAPLVLFHSRSHYCYDLLRCRKVKNSSTPEPAICLLTLSCGDFSRSGLAILPAGSTPVSMF